MKSRYAYTITGILAAVAAATALNATAQDTATTPADPAGTVPSQATVPGSVAPSTTPAPTVEAPNTTATPNPTASNPAEPAVETPATPPANPDAAADSLAQTTPDAAAPSEANAPKTFMQQAFLANEFSKAAAQIALEKGTTPEVKETAQSVLNDSTKTREAMVTAIQSSTSDMNFDQNWTEEYKMKLAELKALEGAEFDAKYLELQGQVTNDSERLYQSFAAQASDESAKTFASATLPTLTAQGDALESVSQGGQ